MFDALLSRRAVFAVAMSGLALCAGPAWAADPYKVAFVYTTPIGDFGYSYQHHLSALAVAKEFGDKVKITEVENVAEGPDAERVIGELAAGGNKLIFTTSFGYMNPVLKVAAQFPDAKFEQATGYKAAANVASYNIRFYEGRYVTGLLAGKATRTDTIGYVASFPIPEVVMGINAAYLGAKKANPNVKFKIVWINTWFDPGKESDAARALIDQGADVLFQHTASPAVVMTAAEKGVWAVGQSSDMAHFAPDNVLTSIANNWSPYVVSRVHAVMDGTWKSGSVWLGMKDGAIAIPPINAKVSGDARKAADAAVADITAGKLRPFTGPIKKQDGSDWLKDGQTASEDELLSMNFYVEGIEGALPK